MNRLIAFTITLLSLASTPLLAQRWQDWISLGDRAMRDQDPFGALRYYEEARKIDSAKAEINYKYAEALAANHAYEKAAFYYYKIYSRDRGILFPQAGIGLASMQKQSGDYEDAKQNWRRVRDQFKKEPDSYWYRKAVQEIRSADLAKEWAKEPVPFELERLPEPINSESSEFAGIYENSGRLVFSSLRGSFDEKGQLQGDPIAYKPRNFMADSNLRKVITVSPESRFNYTISRSGEKYCYVRPAHSGAPSIHCFQKGDETKPIFKIPLEQDSGWYSQPAFGEINGEEVLFFASDRSGGSGQQDIWYVNTAQPFMAPINAGDFVNTAGSELTPFYDWDERKLYFASDWHPGFGGYDLFSSDVIDGRFNYPENLQRPFNSPANDLYYSFNHKLEKGLLTSNRTGSEKGNTAGCCNDIWLFKNSTATVADTLPEIATLEELNDYLPVRLYFHNDEPDPRTRQESTDQDYLATYYGYTRLLPDYQQAYREGLASGEALEAEDAMDGFFINEVDEGVKNLKLFVSLLAKELAEGERVELTVKGFASPLAKTDYNVLLTSRRIASLVNYLKNYERGLLNPYLNGTADNGARLKINRIPFGEYTASAVVSDNPNESNAVYGISAALERKIEIVSIQHALEDSTLAEIAFESLIVDLGSISVRDSLLFAFPYGSSGGLQIDSLATPSSHIKLLDGTTGQEPQPIEGMLYPAGLAGKQRLGILVYGNFAESPKELNITFEIIKE